MAVIISVASIVSFELVKNEFTGEYITDVRQLF